MELAIPLTLRWKQGRDMPFTMTNSIQAIVIDDQVYVGGGYNFDNGRVVMLYTLCTRSWRTLPRLVSRASPFTKKEGSGTASLLAHCGDKLTAHGLVYAYSRR